MPYGFHPKCVVTGPLCISATNTRGKYALVCGRDNRHMKIGNKAGKYVISKNIRKALVLSELFVHAACPYS